jgi:hypothetical protein
MSSQPQGSSQPGKGGLATCSSKPVTSIIMF